MRILIDGIVVECSLGNITAQQDISAIANPAGPGLAPGPGVSGAIHAKAGSGLYQECISHAPLMPGKALITSGHLLPNKYVVHCLPPSGKGDQAVRQLEQCYINALMAADEHGISSIAFPSLISGTLGTPPVSTAGIALGAVRIAAPVLKNVRRIRFVLFDRLIFMQYRNLLAACPECIVQNKSIG